MTADTAFQLMHVVLEAHIFTSSSGSISGLKNGILLRLQLCEVTGPMN